MEDGRTSFSCAAVCSLSALARLSLYSCSSGFSGRALCSLSVRSEPASVVDMVAADGVVKFAIRNDRDFLLVCRATRVTGLEL